MKPLVGVIPLWDDEKESIWMLPAYLDGLKEAGASTVIFPMTQDKEEITRLVGMCDGILLTGGHDVTPSIYGEEPLEGKSVCLFERDEMERMVFEEAMRQDKPVLGICRGIQFLNAILGGTLYQDLPTQHPSSVEHHQTPPYDVPVHEVSIRKDSPLYELLGSERISVNSYHHQAVKDVAPEFSVMAEADDGIVEAVYLPSKKFVWALQWHPEFSYKVDPNSKKIFRAFSDSMKK